MTFDGGLDRLYFNDSVLRNDGMRRFLEDRQRNQDSRLAHLDHLQDGLEDQVVCLTVIDPLPRIQHLEQAIRLRYGRSLALHSHEEHGLWLLAIHDASATKDQGIARVLQGQNLPAPRLVVFGDQINDAGMFRMADEAYAVAGAVPDLAQHATAVIGSNDDDAVARWLDAHWLCYARCG